MPNRILRDELITSEKWWSVSSDARSLWISVFLSADDLGRAPGNSFTCRTKYLAGSITSSERVEKLVEELHDVDLLRIYSVDDARYFFIPRFKQFVRYTRSRYPSPPNEINDIVIEKQRSGSYKATPRRPEVKRSEEKYPIAQTAFALFWDSYPNKKSKGRAQKVWSKLNPSELFIAEILQAVERAKTSREWQRDNGQYIPHPATWLNDRGWEDEAAAPAEKRLMV